MPSSRKDAYARMVGSSNLNNMKNTTHDRDESTTLKAYALQAKLATKYSMSMVLFVLS